jgi:plastocyanin
MISSRKLLALGAIVSAGLVLSACSKNGATPGSSSGSQSLTSQSAQVGAATITATGSGFEPAKVTVKSGEAITWVNKSAQTVSIGSDNHPTHTLDPDLTGGQFIIELAPGESKTVPVNVKGTHGYHNHLQPSQKGTVVIE